ncbi:unnamed protein product [Urochloa humidicola]
MQGDDSISDYVVRMKKVADDFCHVGHPVLAPQLVLNLLRGLNPRFSTTSDDVTNSPIGLPSFKDACDLLKMKELGLANEAKVTSTTTLLTAIGSSTSWCTNPGGCRSTAPSELS